MIKGFRVPRPAVRRSRIREFFLIWTILEPSSVRFARRTFWVRLANPPSSGPNYLQIKKNSLAHAHLQDGPRRDAV